MRKVASSRLAASLPQAKLRNPSPSQTFTRRSDLQPRFHVRCRKLSVGLKQSCIVVGLRTLASGSIVWGHIFTPPRLLNGRAACMVKRLLSQARLVRDGFLARVATLSRRHNSLLCRRVFLSIPDRVLWSRDGCGLVPTRALGKVAQLSIAYRKRAHMLNASRT
jgi:hypothetical protein